MIIQSAALMGILGLLFAILLGFAKRRFYVEVNPRIGKVEEVLPGVNCGGCGYPSCAAYAEAVAENGESVDLCVVGGSETTQAVAHAMGVACRTGVKTARTDAQCSGPNRTSAFCQRLYC